MTKRSSLIFITNTKTRMSEAWDKSEEELEIFLKKKPEWQRTFEKDLSNVTLNAFENHDKK